MKHKILLFAQRVDKDGHSHFGVDEYDTVTGLTIRFTDYFFEAKDNHPAMKPSINNR